MNKQQFEMFCKMLNGFGKAKVKDYTFELKNKGTGLYEMAQYNKGTKIVLKVGSAHDCIEAAKDCVKMMFDIVG